MKLIFKGLGSQMYIRMVLNSLIHLFPRVAECDSLCEIEIIHEIEIIVS